MVYFDSSHGAVYFVEAVDLSLIYISDCQRWTNTLNGVSNSSVHIYQSLTSCAWDEETGETSGFHQYGYDGEDFIVFDLETQMWIALKPQFVITKHMWDRDKTRNDYFKNFIKEVCIDMLLKHLRYGRNSLLRADLPSVSLLQKSPSSPVSCHATGFYPDRALMLWRKDGEDLHEDVDQGEILPNHDGSFQMRVDLDLSSVKPEDWRRYNCVFQLSGVKEEIITKLDKAVIRTNSAQSSDRTSPITAAVAVVAVVFTAAAAAGFIVYKKKKAQCPPCPPDNNSSELSEKLNPET
ncbi:major histocompatibility complex class I-related gene protein-like [Trachinotus anak]|uniref:major histocompatibility complex class I-related gene protein-like n=1 Tax=Trachinotus anak TaxID=443729 RepID=UPI0039F180F5